MWPLVRMMMRSRRFGAFLCLLGFVWGVALLQMTMVVPSQQSSQELREEILDLSEKYVRQLATETQDTIDGPYSGRLTGYDLKKTMAVLLENILTRLDKLEAKLDIATLNGTRKIALEQLLERPQRAAPDGNNAPQPTQSPTVQPTPNPPVTSLRIPEVRPPVNAKDLILGAQEDCTLTEEQQKTFPHCTGKIQWMTSHWQSDKCYALYGVDGSACSFRVYLSEVETWCPLLPGRSRQYLNVTAPVLERVAKINTNLEGLLVKLKDPVNRQENYAWIRQRITSMWPGWVASVQSLAAKNPNITGRAQKKVLVHLGLLSKKSGFKIAENSFKGGPLGELVQWSDIISSLYILGHDIIITSEVEQLAVLMVSQTLGPRSACPNSPSFTPDAVITDIVGFKFIRTSVWFKSISSNPRTLSKLPSAESQCQSRQDVPIDVIYIDIVGLTQFKRRVKAGYGKFSCLLRIIDSFGTEPAFNYEVYAKQHRMKTTWGMQNLNPQQFFTMFPHSPDNSFMGFVVEQHLNDSLVSSGIQKKDQAVVYGKAQYMWQGKETYLRELHKYVSIHSTVFTEDPAKSIIPPYVHNHGILTGPDLHRLLRESKIFVGLGFPYEGPAPLEAIAQGCVYINPRFDPPHNSLNTKFFKGKPTQRKLTSQHPYAEDYIGEPHVFTVDVNDSEKLESVIKLALDAVNGGKVKPYMPYEFTKEGMLQRLGSYIEHQDFCSSRPKLWPPPSSITMVMSSFAQNCKDACHAKGLICEPSYFPQLNSAEQIEHYSGHKCQGVETLEDMYFPAVKLNGGCVLQKQTLLFSCVGESPDFTRLCPCRDYIKGQTALCKECVNS